MIPVAKLEADLFKMYEEYNRHYFSGACQVVAVKFANFQADFRIMMELGMPVQITFGMYDATARTIYLNRFFIWALRHGLFQQEVKFVLFHEMCHAFLLNASQPLRMGMYHPADGHHGSEFERLEHSFEDGIPNIFGNLMTQMMSWMASISPVQ